MGGALRLNTCKGGDRSRAGQRQKLSNEAASVGTSAYPHGWCPRGVSYWDKEAKPSCPTLTRHCKSIVPHLGRDLLALPSRETEPVGCVPVCACMRRDLS